MLIYEINLDEISQVNYYLFKLISNYRTHSDSNWSIFFSVNLLNCLKFYLALGTARKRKREEQEREMRKKRIFHRKKLKKDRKDNAKMKSLII